MPKKLPEIPSKNQLKFIKTLLTPSLLKTVRNEFEKVPEHRSRAIEYSLVDVLMSGLTVFGLKYSSLLLQI